MANQKQWDFAKQVYQAAKGGEIHPLFVAAQAVLETGWGKSTIGKNNIFGITKGSWTGPVDMVQTTEYFSNGYKTMKAPDRILKKVRIESGKWKYTVYRAFRHYESLKECLEDHLSLFKKPMYSDAWDYRDDPLTFALKICDKHGAKYATSPTYYKNLRALILQLRAKEEWLSNDN